MGPQNFEKRWCLGIGTLLTQRICRQAAGKGHSFVSLTTFHELTWNTPFYLRICFEKIPARLPSPTLNSVLADELLRGLNLAGRAGSHLAQRGAAE